MATNHRAALRPFSRAIPGGLTSGSYDRFVRRFQVSRVGFDAIGPQRRSWTRTPSKRTADKCARLYRPSTLVALRRGLETYETAALPLSYVGADRV